MMWLTSFSGFNCRWWPSCPGWPPVLRPDGSLLRRGFACGGSDDGGFEEFRDVCLSRASRFASRCSSSVTSTRTATGVAVQSSVLIPGGGPTSCIVAVVLITNLPLRQSRIPTLSGYVLGAAAAAVSAHRREALFKSGENIGCSFARLPAAAGRGTGRRGHSKGHGKTTEH
jgi:hypothetical protein